MSNVTDVLVIYSVVEGPDLTEKLYGQDVGELGYATKGQRFANNVAVAEAWGGCKEPQVEVAAGAFNWLEWEPFWEWLRSLPWARSDEVLVVVNFEHGDRPEALYLPDVQPEP